jgi:hypothetical protein
MIRRLVWLKLRSSPVVISAAVLFPVLLAFFWAEESYRTALKACGFLLPNFFLLLSYDQVGDGTGDEGLANVLFLENGARDYLAGKALLLSAFGVGYSLALFAPLWIFGLWTGEARLPDAAAFPAALAAGFHLFALGALLGFFMKGGSNVLAVIVLQAVEIAGLLLAASNRATFLEFLARGVFPGFQDKLKFLFLAVGFPNIIAAAPLRRYAPGIAFSGFLLLLLYRIMARRKELTNS